MNIFVFWILFLGLWGIVPLMIIKGRRDEKPSLKTVPEVKTRKKGWFKQNLINSKDLKIIFFSILNNYK